MAMDATRPITTTSGERQLYSLASARKRSHHQNRHSSRRQHWRNDLFCQWVSTVPQPSGAAGQPEACRGAARSADNPTGPPKRRHNTGSSDASGLIASSQPLIKQTRHTETISQSHVELSVAPHLPGPRRTVAVDMMSESEGGHVQNEAPRLWFAIRVRSNYERVAAAHLRERGFDEFSPSYQTQRRWSDRTKTIEQSLFPGYVFSRFNPQDRLPVLTVPGVVGLVGLGKTPSPIPDQEIETIRRMVQSGLLVRPWPFLEVGQRVLIERGPLAGVEGILQHVKGRFRLVVAISLLHRAVSAEVDRTWVRPIKPSATKPVLTDRSCPG
jgi:transcription antitermination factor NusG